MASEITLPSQGLSDEETKQLIDDVQNGRVESMVEVETRIAGEQWPRKPVAEPSPPVPKIETDLQ